MLWSNECKVQGKMSSNILRKSPIIALMYSRIVEGVTESKRSVMFLTSKKRLCILANLSVWYTYICHYQFITTLIRMSQEGLLAGRVFRCPSGLSCCDHFVYPSVCVSVPSSRKIAPGWGWAGRWGYNFGPTIRDREIFFKCIYRLNGER